MIIAVIAVRVMKVAVNKVVDVIAMWHGFVAAVGTVNMSCLMTDAAVVRRALVRVLGSYFKRVFIHVARMHVVQMAVMKIVNVITMRNGGVAARRPVLVSVFAGMF